MEAGSQHDDEARQAVHSLWWREYTLGEEGRFADQLACVDDIQRRYASSVDPEVRAVAVRTLSGRVAAALSSGDLPLAAATTQSLAENVGRETDPSVRRALAQTTLEVAITTAWDGRWAIGPFAGSLVAPLQRWRSLHGRARIKAALEHRRRMVEAVTLAERLVDTLADSADDALRSVAVQATILAGVTDVLLGRWQQGNAHVGPLLEDEGARVAMVIDLATPGRCNATERIAAVIARTHPATRAKAESLLRSCAPGYARWRWPRETVSRN